MPAIGLTVRAFGRLEIEDGNGLVDLGGPRPRVVFALLLVAAGRAVSTDRLVDEVWGDEPPSSARRTLQSYVATMRRRLGGEQGSLQPADGGYRLDPACLSVDIDLFERLADEGRELIASGSWHDASEVLRRALDLWDDAPFADLAVEDVPTLAIERTRLTELRLDLIEQRAESELALGRHRDVVPELEAVVADHPEREGLWESLVVALHEAGRQRRGARRGPPAPPLDGRRTGRRTGRAAPSSGATDPQRRTTDSRPRRHGVPVQGPDAVRSGRCRPVLRAGGARRRAGGPAGATAVGRRGGHVRRRQVVGGARRADPGAAGRSGTGPALALHRDTPRRASAADRRAAGH